MRIAYLPQIGKLMEWMRGYVSESMSSGTRYALARRAAADGKVRLLDRAMNTVDASGGRLVLRVPDVRPGLSRDFLVRIRAAAETELSVEGAEGIEGDSPNVLGAVEAGATALVFFTEVEAGVFAVSRKAVERIGLDG